MGNYDQDMAELAQLQQRIAQLQSQAKVAQARIAAGQQAQQEFVTQSTLRDLAQIGRDPQEQFVTESTQGDIQAATQVPQGLVVGKAQIEPEVTVEIGKAQLEEDDLDDRVFRGGY